MSAFSPGLHGVVFTCLTGKVRFIQCWDTIEVINDMISQDFYRTDSGATTKEHGLAAFSEIPVWQYSTHKNVLM